MNRRGFLATIAGAFVADPERLLWVPGAKLISIPAPTLYTVAIETGYPLVSLRMISIEALKILHENLALCRDVERQHNMMLENLQRRTSIGDTLKVRAPRVGENPIRARRA